MKEKWYEFHWLNGDVTYNKGDSPSSAIGVGAGGVKALDYYCEAKELPENLREIIVTDLNNNTESMNPETMLYKLAKEQLLNGNKEIVINVYLYTWKFNLVNSSPFAYYLRQISVEKK